MKTDTLEIEAKEYPQFGLSMKVGNEFWGYKRRNATQDSK